MYGIVYWKALNFFYAERCGAAIRAYMVFVIATGPVCITKQRIAINGGWHDAGDLTQGLGIPGRSFTAFLAWLSGYNARGEKK